MSSDTSTITIVGSTDQIISGQNLSAATSLIDYQSNGHCLIIGPQDKALSIAESLNVKACTVVQIEPNSVFEKKLTEHGVAVYNVAALTLTGYLGAFEATVIDNDKTINLAVHQFLESGLFDTVLDLSDQPLIAASLPPFGYYSGNSEAKLANAIDELPELNGEFEKPKYFNYDSAICAHTRSKLTGCSQCIDICATGAIVSDGEGVRVDPYMCQGCGSCATVCPSGAMSYAYPKPADAINRSRELLNEQAINTLLLHTEDDEPVALSYKSDWLEPMLVEEVSAFGLDYWLSMLASGFHRIVLLCKPDKSDPNYQALIAQTHVLSELLQGLGIEQNVVSCVTPDELEEHMAANFDAGPLATLKPASFVTHNDKRQTIRMAMDALSVQLKPLRPIQPLSSGAPFGKITIDTKACTLCMSCVSICPAKALLDGQDTPALRMIEANCLQCGLCETACPESAISLKSQYTFDSISARSIQTLHEEEPFHCIKCHKAFATMGIIESMFAKLEGHWMFKDETAKRRLKMCEDCRVKDIFEHSRDGIDVHKNEPE